MGTVHNPSGNVIIALIGEGILSVRSCGGAGQDLLRATNISCRYLTKKLWVIHPSLLSLICLVSCVRRRSRNHLILLPPNPPFIKVPQAVSGMETNSDKPSVFEVARQFGESWVVKCYLLRSRSSPFRSFRWRSRVSSICTFRILRQLLSSVNSIARLFVFSSNICLFELQTG